MRQATTRTDGRLFRKIVSEEISTLRLVSFEPLRTPHLFSPQFYQIAFALLGSVAGQFSDSSSSTTISFSASRFIQQPGRKIICEGPDFLIVGGRRRLHRQAHWFEGTEFLPRTGGGKF